MLTNRIIVSLIFSFLISSGLSNAQTVKDIDGNVYNTVTIGTQTWIIENLQTTKYRNGDLIGTSSPSTLDIRSSVSPTYNWAYENKENNAEVYGRLYTWYTVTDSRGICPIGWHVSTDAEWTTLTNFLGGDIVAYSKLKETGDSHWIKYDTGTNELGFNARGSGIFFKTVIRILYIESTPYERRANYTLRTNT